MKPRPKGKTVEADKDTDNKVKIADQKKNLTIQED